jgi:broad specificity phosphatase PhoE
MSTMYLVRHGQASFGAEDYDVLSELGATQSKLLGSHLAARRPIDAIYTGPLRRQRDTTLHLIEAARAAGASWPEPTLVPGLDEMPAFDILRLAVPMLRSTDPELRALVDATARQARRRDFQAVYERVMAQWMLGALALEGVETFAAFAARVDDALDGIMREAGRGKTVIAVTSGGPISLAMRRTLGLSDERVLRLQSVIANSSITELRFREDELTLTGFNALPHLVEELVTYR